MDVTPGDNLVAIIDEGRILLEAEPLRAVEAVQPDLKDVYFSVMAGKPGGPPVAPP